MKYLVLTLFGAGILFGSAYYLNRTKLSTSAPSRQTIDSPVAAGVADQSRSAPATHRRDQWAQAPEEKSASQAHANPSVAVPGVKLDAATVNWAVDLLVSPQATYEQKQSAWRQLRDGGGLDQAIVELEQRTANNQGHAEYPAALGQAYLKKCGTISDVREQGILAMQADKVFDTALNLDPSNWDARFTKAVALSYWPATMNKGEEVVQHFLTLIEQQETQPPQPQFAETYAWLGDQYKKAGQSEDARTVWERGAALYPDNQKLRTKLTGSP